MPKTHHNDMVTSINTIPDRPLTGLPRSAPSTTRDGGEKVCYWHATRQHPKQDQEKKQHYNWNMEC